MTGLHRPTGGPHRPAGESDGIRIAASTGHKHKKPSIPFVAHSGIKSKPQANWAENVMPSRRSIKLPSAGVAGKMPRAFSGGKLGKFFARREASAPYGPYPETVWVLIGFELLMRWRDNGRAMAWRWPEAGGVAGLPSP